MNKRLLSYVARRLGWIVVTIVLLTLVLFVLEKRAPGDPVRALVGRSSSPEAVEAVRESLGYNDPVVVQYVNYLSGLPTGDLGTSLHTRQPVRSDLARFLPASLELMVVSIGIALVAAFVLGLTAAARFRGSSVVRVGMLGAASTPTFLLGLLAIIFLYGRWQWLPASGRTSVRDAPKGPTRSLLVDSLLHGQISTFVDVLKHLALPAICLSIWPAVAIGRIFRSSLVSTMESDFIRTARAKGLPGRAVIWRHAIRNSMSAALAMAGLMIGATFASVAVVEVMFSWPGVGLYLTNAISQKDFPAVMGVALVGAVVYLVVNVVVDILQAVIDPRLQLA